MVLVTRWLDDRVILWVVRLLAGLMEMVRWMGEWMDR